MDWLMIGFISPFILIFAICGIQLFRGKWLMLMAGYNTASKKEREKMNGKALGKLVGSISLICSFLMLILALFPTPTVILLFIILVFSLVVAGLIYEKKSDTFKSFD